MGSFKITLKMDEKLRKDISNAVKDTVRGKTLSTANGPVQSLGDGAVGDCVTLDKAQKQRL